MKSERRIVAILYARPAEAPGERREALWGLSVRALDVDAAALGASFEITLEQALAAIERHPRGFVELDGSFTLVVEEDDGPSRIEGEVYDRAADEGDRVHHVDVRGPNRTSPWRALFEALAPRGGPAGLVVVLAEEGVALAGNAFLELLSRES